MHINYGQAIPCDGLYIDGESFEVNEASLTGEPDNLKKNKVSVTMSSRPRFKSNRYAGIFCAYAYPAPHPEYPGQIEAVFLRLFLPWSWHCVQ